MEGVYLVARGTPGPGACSLQPWQFGARTKSVAARGQVAEVSPGPGGLSTVSL